MGYRKNVTGLLKKKKGIALPKHYFSKASRAFKMVTSFDFVISLLGKSSLRS